MHIKDDREQHQQQQQHQQQSSHCVRTATPQRLARRAAEAL